MTRRTACGMAFLFQFVFFQFHHPFLLFYIRESRIFSIISGVYLIIPSLKSEAIHC